jgi:hypothetical protein
MPPFGCFRLKLAEVVILVSSLKLRYLKEASQIASLLRGLSFKKELVFRKLTVFWISVLKVSFMNFSFAKASRRLIFLRANWSLNFLRGFKVGKEKKRRVLCVTKDLSLK